MSEIDFEGRDQAGHEGAAPAAPALTREALQAMSPSEVDSLLRAFVQTAADARALRLRLIDLEDRYMDAQDHRAWTERSMEGMALELDRVKADRDVVAANAQALMLELSMFRMATEDRGNAMSLLGLAVGLLLEGGVGPDDPRVQELAGKSKRLGIGASTPVRTSDFKPATAPRRGGTSTALILPFTKPASSAPDPASSSTGAPEPEVD